MNEILLAILLISASVMCIFIVIYLGRITNIIGEVRSDIKKISGEIPTLISSVDKLARSSAALADEVRTELNKVDFVVEAVKSRVQKYVEFEERLLDRFTFGGKDADDDDDDKSVSLVTNLRAIGEGVKTFWAFLRRK